MADGLLISILSLMKHVSTPLHIYILTATIATREKQYQPLSDETVAFLRNQVESSRAGGTVEKIDITQQFNAHQPEANMDTIFTPYCMLRLFSDRVPQLPDRLLYMDTDVVCRRDPQSFYDQDLTGTEVVGVLDHYGKWFFHNQWWGLDYMNSGLMLMNMKLIREDGLFARCRELCEIREMFMPDQTALNKLSTAKKLVPRRYNEQRKLHGNTVFQHFTTSFRLFPWIHTLTVKPWQVDKVHRELKLHEYDDVLAEYQKLVGSMRS